MKNKLFVMFLCPSCGLSVAFEPVKSRRDYKSRTGLEVCRLFCSPLAG